MVRKNTFKVKELGDSDFTCVQTTFLSCVFSFTNAEVTLGLIGVFKQNKVRKNIILELFMSL